MTRIVAGTIADPVDNAVVDWLLAGDPAIVVQTRRDILGERGSAEKLRTRIATEGWGRRYLQARRPDGHWGRGFYQPKWTSTHYTLVDLAALGLPRDNPEARASVDLVLSAPRGRDGGINYARTLPLSDVCINGMILAFASWFRPEDQRLRELVDYLLAVRQPDGGWNCEYHHGSRRSSLHTTLSVLEGLWAFRALAGDYRTAKIDEALGPAVEFILAHRLYQVRKTGAVIDPRFLRFTYPPRWRFDALRALDSFQKAGVAYDERMSDALGVIQSKRQPDGRWLMAAPHPGEEHFRMEEVGKPSRWNTLRATRVLMHFGLL